MPDKTVNNGGATNYYDVPEGAKTLNDLIEYKNMKPWQHEVFKATYALDERATKATDGSSSKLREINKILYFAQRGKELILKELKKQGELFIKDTLGEEELPIEVLEGYRAMANGGGFIPRPKEEGGSVGRFPKRGFLPGHYRKKQKIEPLEPLEAEFLEAQVGLTAHAGGRKTLIQEIDFSQHQPHPKAVFELTEEEAQAITDR